jgi:hypothetical protein
MPVRARHALPLRAWTQNGVLHVTGLTPGQPWHICNLYGQLTYAGVAVEENAEIRLTVKGLYIIQSGAVAIKVMVND